MGICYIVGAGEFGDGLPLPGKEDMLIACDGGYAHCRERGIRMDLVVGDFDSLKEVPQHPGVIVLKPEKDETDTGWAVMEGFQRGYREFVIYGGTGGRIRRIRYGRIDGRGERRGICSGGVCGRTCGIRA